MPRHGLESPEAFRVTQEQNLAEFSSCGGYVRFQHVVRRVSRYVRPPDVEEFLQAVLSTAKKREERLKRGAVLWRAQLGHDHKATAVDHGLEVPVPCPYPPGRMKPLADRAFEGRASPKGIPVLYLAIERETALLEVRPWLGSLVSIAQFELKKDLRVVDCSLGSAKVSVSLWPSFIVGGTMKEPPPDERERSVWTDIDLAFAQPVNRRDDVADYAPTQVIADLLKRGGYDGIKYRSSLSATGHNVALFDLAAADLARASCKLYQPTKIDFQFKDVT